jgi:hypothetical protein
LYHGGGRWAAPAHGEAGGGPSKQAQPGKEETSFGRFARKTQAKSFVSDAILGKSPKIRLSGGRRKAWKSPAE